jgi:cytochrome c oxidase subunit III
MTTSASHHEAARNQGGHSHHFDSAEHEYDSDKQGLWLFMVTEILMFGGLFVAYAIFHSIYPEMFSEGASHLNWKMGFVNTLVLISSSLTMALGIFYNQQNQPKKAFWNLVATILLGCCFLVIKYFEYTGKFHHGIFPGRMMNLEEVKPEHANLGLYFGLYFCMTGLHGIHVVIGMCLIGWCAMRTARGDFNEHYFTPVEGVGIFWHIVDLIWIFLFPLLYLVG